MRYAMHILASLLLISALAAGQAVVPFETVAVSGRDLPRHAGDYGSPALAWQRTAGVTAAAGIWPHPVRPDVAVLATESALLRTDDAGQSWQALSAAVPLGRVTHVAWPLDSDQTLYAATAARGLWRSDDGGKTFARIGSTETGLADDAVAGVALDPSDLTGRTLLAWHGDAAAGISRSVDGGQSWHVISEGYHVHKLLPGRLGSPAVHMAGAAADNPYVQGLYYSQAPGRYWNELAHDVLVTDAAMDLTGEVAWFSSPDAGAYRISHNGGLVEAVSPAGAASLDSLTLTWGPTADAVRVLAYDARRLGLVSWSDEPTEATAQAAGLPTGPFIREGARLRANANGTVLWLLANGELYRGTVAAAGPLAVRHARVEPAEFALAQASYADAGSEIHRRLPALSGTARLAPHAPALLAAFDRRDRAWQPVELTVRAEVAGSPAVVTVDLSRLGLSARTPLLDDGQHDDGAAGDGLWATRFTVDPRRIESINGDWRGPWPGAVGLTVSAMDAEGRLAGQVAVLALRDRPGAVIFWNEEEGDRRVRDAVGAVGSAIEEEGGFQSRRCLRIDAPTTGWALPFGNAWRSVNVTGWHAMSFRLRADRPDAPPLRVHLRDNPAYVPPTTTAGLDLAAVGLTTLPAEYRRVVVPLAELLAGAPDFQTARLGWVVFSGPGGEPARYWIDDIRLYPDAESLARDLAGEP